MARETSRSGSAVPTASVEAPGQKRKRAIDADPSPSLKITLPSASSLQTATPLPKVRLTLSPTKANGSLPASDADENPAPDPKKQKISLKLNGVKATAVTAGGGDPVKAGGDAKVAGGTADGNVDSDEATDDQVVKQEKAAHALSRDVREALSIVIEQMAIGLPKPLNEILTLWMPPTFEQVKTNTLGFVLRRTDLTWEELVETLHALSANCLQSAAYPTPFPSLPDFHLPVPPLPSYQPPHGIYNFFASLRDTMLAIEPPSSTSLADKLPQQKWALMMRAPTARGLATHATWWSSVADPRATKEALDKLKAAAEKEGKTLEGEGALEVMAADGAKFGFAQPVSLASVIDTKAATGPTLGERLIARASLKANQWKEQAAKRPRGFFGSVRRPVQIAATMSAAPDSVAHLPWTPSFAPTYDSSNASGGMGYWATLDAMHYKARYGAWKRYLDSTSSPIADQGYSGSLPARVKKVGGEAVEMEVEVSDAPLVAAEPLAEANEVDEMIEKEQELDVGTGEKGQGKSVAEQLDENAVWINELLGWQEARAFNGFKEVGERENLVAEILQESLIDLVSQQAPSSIVALQTGDAHDLAKKLISTSAPVVRGILDPARTKAIHDNYTVHAKPPASSSATSAPAPRTAAPTGNPSSGLSMAQQLAGTPRPYAPRPPRPNPSTPANQTSNMPPIPRYNYTPGGQAPPAPQGQGVNMTHRPPMPGPPSAGPGGQSSYHGYGNTAPVPAMGNTYRPPTPQGSYGYSSPMPPNNSLPGPPPPQQNMGNGGQSPYGRPMMQPSPSPVNGNIMLPNQGSGYGGPPPQQQPMYGQGYTNQPQAPVSMPAQSPGPWGSQPYGMPPPQGPPQAPPQGYGYQPQPPSPAGMSMHMGPGPGPGPGQGMPMRPGPGQGMGMPMGVNMNMGMNMPMGPGPGMGMPGYGMPGQQGPGPGPSPYGGPNQGYVRPGMAPSGLRQSFGPA